MFWKKKQEAAPAVAAGAPGAVTAAAQAVAGAGVKGEKLHGPQEIPELAGRNLVVAKKLDPDYVWHLKAVIRGNPSRGKKVCDVRVFDEAKAAEKKVKVKDWTTLDQYPDLILYEGWFDKGNLTAELEKKAG